MAAPIKSSRKPAPAQTRAGRRLGRYNEKRDLQASGEPTGGSAKTAAGRVRRFVIHKHDATRLHYDFRLEMDGVYRSWAVPKGLPTSPGERNLAVEVEDHPLEYGNFEGVIPAGNYGAGSVMLWDRGHYTMSGPSPEAAYREGKIHLALAGQKCVGEWTLVRLRPRPGDKKTNWIVIKNSAPAHRAPITGAGRDLSVLSRRSLEEIADGSERRAGGARSPATSAAANNRSRRAHPPAQSRSAATARAESPQARKAGGSRSAKAAPSIRRETTGRTLAPAEFIPPMKALSVDEVPAGQWRLEIKYDGFRAVAVVNHGSVDLWSRNHKPLTDHYPEVVEALKKIRCANAVIDGEIVALDEQGHSRFQLLQNRGAGQRAPIVYYVFDLLHHDGRSLLNVPIEERQIALEVLIGRRTDAVRFSPVFDVAPEKLLAEVRKKGLEGIIAKTPGSAYEPDRRSGTWLKCKVHGEQEFVIGGFTPPRNSRKHFGAILVGYYDRSGTLQYAGKVGSGFNTELLTTLHREFMKRRADVCPFVNLPAARKTRYGTGMTASEMKKVTWLRPELVAQIQFTEWTAEGSLRHPVFLGLRDDKRPREVVREG